jgi:hypothetical protein
MNALKVPKEDLRDCFMMLLLYFIMCCLIFKVFSVITDIEML